jgi:hypothetical protein
MVSCIVDEVAGIMKCESPGAGTGNALGAITIGGGSAYVVLTRSPELAVTPDSSIFDVTLTNVMNGQIMGTKDGITADSAGMKFFFYNASDPSPQPKVLTKIDPAQPASVTPISDGMRLFAGAGSTPRHFFKHGPQVLAPGQSSTPKQWKFHLQNVATWSFIGYISTEVPWPKGWLDIIPEAPVVEVSGTATLTAQVRNALGRPFRENLVWNSSNTAVVTVAENAIDSTAVITGVSEGTAWVKAASVADPINRRDSVLVTVNNAPAVPLDSINALTNVSIAVSPVRLRDGLAEGDSVVPSQVYDSEHGYAVIDADRQLTYVADGGYFGADTVRYDVTDGQWTVEGTLLVNVAPTNYWFVQQGATGDGSNTRPLGSIAAAVDSAGVGDTIFVLRNGSSDLVGAATLEAGQALIGHGVSAAFLLTADGLNEPAGVDTVFQGRGLGTPLMNTGAPVLTVAANNTVRGVNITSSAAAGIHGVDFGTLTVGEVIVQAGGPSLSLSNGDLAGSFLALHSTNSDSSGISLTSVGGSLTATGSSITGAATTAFSVTGGSVAIGFPGDVTHAGTGRLLQVSSHSGNGSFAGTLTATAGTGVLLSAAEGSYAFTGALSLNGGDAGLDVTSSGGSFTFADAAVSNPVGGPAVHVVGGSPAMFYRGSITHNTGRAVVVDGITADSVVLRAAIISGTPNSPTGLGILVQNVAGGLVALDSTKSLFTSANPAVTLNNAAGAVRFGHSLDITTTTGAGFTASGVGTVTVTGLNTVATGTGIPVSLASVNTGTAGVSFSSISTGAGAVNGIVLNGISGVGFQGTGGTIAATTGPAVLLTNTNTADSVSLRGMTLSRSGGTGAVISGTSFGRLHALNTSVQATGAPGALALATGTMSGTYSAVSSSASTGSGVSLTGVDGTFNASAGSINTAGAAAFLLSGGSVGGTVSVTVAQASAQPLLSAAGDHNGTITFAGNLTAINGTGLQFTAADGTYNVTGSLSLAGGDAGIDIGSGSSGTVNVSPAGANTAAITSPSGIAITVAGGSADLNYNGNVTQATNAALLSVTGGHTGDVAFPSGTVSAINGNGLQFDNADGTYDFDGTVTMQGGDAGIDITNGSGGTFTFPATANIVSPSTGNLVSILNSAPTFTYSGAFTKANNNVTGILVSSNTGGSVTFNGTGTRSISSGTAAAVNLANNGSTSILFSGGGLSITSVTGAGFTATGGGTVQVTGGANTISSTGGIALNVQNTTIGASGLSFLSINADGGANGIVLSNTGSTNGLQVTGSGTNGSGGTIRNTTVSGASFTDSRNVNLGQMNFTNANSADGGGAGSCDQDTNAGCNAAIELSNVTTVNLDRLNVNGTVEHGINGRMVTGFSLTNSTILNAGDSGSEFAVSLFELFGTAGAGTESLISGNTLSEAGEHVVFVRNSTATSTSPASPDRLVISGNTIADPGTRNAVVGSQGGGVAVSLRGTANFQTVVQNNTFLASETGTDGVRVDAGENARSDATVTGNHFSGSYAVGSTNIAAYNTAVNVSGSGSSNTTFSVTDNPTVMVGIGDAINVASTGDANLSGTISGHTIGTPAGLHDGSANHNNLENDGFGIDIVVEQTGSIVANVTGNTVTGGHKTGFHAIAHSGNGGSVDASVSDNVFNAGGRAAEWPVVLMAGNDAAGESVRLCVNLSNNQTSTTALATNHYRMGVHDAPAAGFNNVMQLQGLVPASGATEAQVETHVDATDPSAPSAGADKVEALGGEVINYTAATCATP